MTDRILACPFCGESASVEAVEGKATGETRFSVGCQKEDCFGFQNYLTFARRGDAICAWNTRNYIYPGATVIRAPASPRSPPGERRMTLDEFTEMVRHHDLTYSYSDDGEVWRRGKARYDAIRKAADTLPRDDVERVWNAEVDRKLVENARSTFYWQWPSVPVGGTR